MTDCPSALSPRETHLLQFYARDRPTVEAGALLGYSTIQLAQVSPQVVSIDRHEGYTAPTLRRYLSNLERAGVRGKVLPVVGDAVVELPRHPGSFAFLDLTGAYGLTFAALKAVRAPLVGVHDFGRSRCAGVADAVRAAGWRVIEQVDTLAILEAA